MGSEWRIGASGLCIGNKRIAHREKQEAQTRSHSSDYRDVLHYLPKRTVSQAENAHSAPRKRPFRKPEKPVSQHGRIRLAAYLWNKKAKK